MTRAWTVGVNVEDAAIAYGCDPETMKRHYRALDEQAIADRVLGRINGASPAVPETVDDGRADRPASPEN